MKVTIQADLLQKKLSFLSHGVSNKPQLPILSNILIDVKDQRVMLSSTDLEIGVESSLPGNVEEEGGVAVPAKTFIELISSLNKDEITLETKTPGTLSVTTKRTKSSFQVLPREEFPKLYETLGNRFAVINQSSIRKDITAVVFSSSTDMAKPAYSGVLLKKEKGETTHGFLLVATDGFRLSLKHHLLSSDESNPEDLQSLIVPSRLFKELNAMKEDTEELELYVSSQHNQLIFQQGGTRLIGRLVAAEYPPYERIIPTDFSAQITFEREELQKAVKICSIFARDSANIIKLSLEQGKILVSSQGNSSGENTVEVEAELKGEANEIAFNARYLLEFLANIDAEELTFEMMGPLNPGVFHIKGDSSYIHIIMPIRIQG